MLHITNVILCSQNAHVCLSRMKLTACYIIASTWAEYFWLVAFYLCLLKLGLSTKVITLLIARQFFFSMCDTYRMSNLMDAKLLRERCTSFCVIIFARYRQKDIIPFYYVSLDSCIIRDNVYFNTFSYILLSPLVVDDWESYFETHKQKKCARSAIWREVSIRTYLLLSSPPKRKWKLISLDCIMFSILSWMRACVPNISHPKSCWF